MNGHPPSEFWSEQHLKARKYVSQRPMPVTSSQLLQVLLFALWMLTNIWCIISYFSLSCEQACYTHFRVQGQLHLPNFTVLGSGRAETNNLAVQAYLISPIPCSLLLHSKILLLVKLWSIGIGELWRLYELGLLMT